MRSCLFLILSSVWSIEKTSKCLILKSVFFFSSFSWKKEKKKEFSAFCTADWFQFAAINKCTKETFTCVKKLQANKSMVLFIILRNEAPLILRIIFLVHVLWYWGQLSGISKEMQTDFLQIIRGDEPQEFHLKMETNRDLWVFGFVRRLWAQL